MSNNFQKSCGQEEKDLEWGQIREKVFKKICNVLPNLEHFVIFKNIKYNLCIFIWLLK